MFSGLSLRIEFNPDPMKFVTRGIKTAGKNGFAKQ